MEGMHCFNPASGCNMSGLTMPIAEYSHSEGEAVMGGYVYSGTAIPSLTGAYVFWGLHQRDDVATGGGAARNMDAHPVTLDRT